MGAAPKSRLLRRVRRGKPSKPSTSAWLGLKSEAHDRRAVANDNIPMNARIATYEVDDPNPTTGETERIVVVRSIANDPLAWMHAHSRIDDAKFHAGRAWQVLYGRAMLGSIQSVDTSKEPVDGGSWPDLLTDGQAMAIHELRRIAVKLEPERALLVEDVLGRGMFIRQAAEARGDLAERAIGKWGRELHIALDILAIELGFATRPRG